MENQFSKGQGYGGRIELLTSHTLNKKITTRANTQKSLTFDKVNIL